MRHDQEQFDKLRYTLISDVNRINKQLRKRLFKKHHAKKTSGYSELIQEETQKVQQQANNVSRELYKIKRSHQKDKYSIVDSSEANLDGEEAAAAQSSTAQ